MSKEKIYLNSELVSIKKEINSYFKKGVGIYLLSLHEFSIYILFNILEENLNEEPLEESKIQNIVDFQSKDLKSFLKVLKKEGIIFNPSYKTKTSRKVQTKWKFDKELTTLYFLFKHRRIEMKLRKGFSKEEQEEYYCINKRCEEYKVSNNIYELLKRGNEFKCKNCRNKLVNRNTDEEFLKTENEKKEKLNIFLKETSYVKKVFTKLHNLFQKKIEIENKIEVLEYNLEIEKIENLGKDFEDSLFSNLFNYKGNINSQEKEGKNLERKREVELEKVKELKNFLMLDRDRKESVLIEGLNDKEYNYAYKMKGNKSKEKENLYFYVESLNKKIKLNDINDDMIDEMSENDYLEYCKLLL